MVSCLLSAQENVISSRSGTAVDWEPTKWVDSVMRAISTIKPGMTRGHLLRVFREEGGISNRRQQVYVYKQCPYIKVDVEFTPVGDEADELSKAPADKIIRISRPYLQYTIAD
jgi:hypothetical protein